MSNSIDNNQTIFDIDQTLLKIQYEHAKRFANPEMMWHPQLKNIQSALQLIQPQQLRNILANTQEAINGNGATTHLTNQDMPLLVEPKADSGNIGKGGSTYMFELLLKITQLTSDNSIQNQLAQLHMYNAQITGAANIYSEFASTLVEQGEHWANSSDALNQAQAESSELEKEVKSAETDLKNKQSILARLEAQAQGQHPIPAKLNQEIDDAKTAVIASQLMLDNKKQELNSHTSVILNPAIQIERSALQILENTLRQCQLFIDTLSIQQQLAIENQRKQNDQQSISPLSIILLITKLIYSAENDNCKAAAELKSKLSEAAAKDSEKKAKEYEDNVRKAEEMQKTMGCIGKILGWVITAVSFTAAIFTGGTSLAFATIGLALAIGDEINQAVNGVSFMAEVMKPLMEGIIQPMMEILGGIFTDILESFGIDKSTAQMIGQIMGAIAAAILMVAAVVVAGSITDKLSDFVAKKIGSNIMNKIMNNVVVDLLKQCGQGLGSFMGMGEAKIAQIGVRTEMALSIANFGNVAAQTTGNIIVAEIKVDAAKIKAKLQNNAALQEILHDLLERPLDAFKNRIESANAIIKNMSSIIENNMQTGQFIIRRIGSVAG